MVIRKFLSICVVVSVATIPMGLAQTRNNDFPVDPAKTANLIAELARLDRHVIDLGYGLKSNFMNAHFEAKKEIYNETVRQILNISAQMDSQVGANVLESQSILKSYLENFNANNSGAAFIPQWRSMVRAQANDCHSRNSLQQSFAYFLNLNYPSSLVAQNCLRLVRTNEYFLAAQNPNITERQIDDIMLSTVHYLDREGLYEGRFGIQGSSLRLIGVTLAGFEVVQRDGEHSGELTVGSQMDINGRTVFFNRLGVLGLGAAAAGRFNYGTVASPGVEFAYEYASEKRMGTGSLEGMFGVAIATSDRGDRLSFLVGPGVFGQMTSYREVVEPRREDGQPSARYGLSSPPVSFGLGTSVLGRVGPLGISSLGHYGFNETSLQTEVGLSLTGNWRVKLEYLYTGDRNRGLTVEPRTGTIETPAFNATLKTLLQNLENTLNEDRLILKIEYFRRGNGQ
jgi:hypothetical protein